jgi:hypothetical protein
VTQDGSGTYHASGTRPTYSLDGSYSVVVGISEDNASTTATDTQNVTETAINGNPVPLVAVSEGDTGAVVEVATFTHANGIFPPNAFTVAVDWGIAGHHSDPGAVTQDGSGTYHATAHRPVYAEDGSYSVVVSISGDSNSTSVTDSQQVNEPTIVGGSATLAAINEGDAPASAEVATFTHDSGVEPAGDFTATIDWGISGHHSDAGAVTQDGSGTYHVAGTRPAFSEEGGYSVVVSIGEDNGSTTVTDSQQVNEPALVGASATLASVNEGNAPASAEVATFTHANGVEPTTDFTATIDWGIAGHHSDVGTVTQDGGGTYHVSGTRPTYKEEGTYGVAVTISEDNASTAVNESQLVNEPAVVGASSSLAAVNEGNGTASVEVATFTHANGVEPTGDFSATIDWGITGHHADPGVITQDGGGTYHVSGTRPTYKEEGSYSVSVAISEDNGSTTVTDSQQVNEPAISATGVSLPAVNEGDAAASVQVATFTHANGVEPNGDFTATIDWGITGHHSDPGVITQDGGGTYHVAGTRPVYAEEGSYSVAVTISEDNGSASVTDTQVVTEPAIYASSAKLATILVGQASATVEVASFTHANGVEPTGDFTTTIDWGINGHHGDHGTITVDGNGTYHVSATRPVYGIPGSFRVSVVITEDNASTTVTDHQMVFSGTGGKNSGGGSTSSVGAKSGSTILSQGVPPAGSGAVPATLSNSGPVQGPAASSGNPTTSGSYFVGNLEEGDEESGGLETGRLRKDPLAIQRNLVLPRPRVL